jgi:integrase
MTTFSDLAEPYLSCRATCAAHQANVRRVAAAAGPVTVAALNAYIKKRLTERTTVTVRNERSMLLSLWKHAYESGLIDAMPRGVVRFKIARQPTRAWTVEQLRRAVDATFDMDERYLRCGASRGQMLRAWLLLGYECGARMGDLWSFRREHVDGRVLRWTQSKTGDPICRTLSTGCVEAIGEMLDRSPDGRILGWVCTQRNASRIMRDFLSANGLPGTSKWLRRSGATHLEIERPGSARLHLGHRSVGLAERAYIDWGQIRDLTPATPELLTR